MKFSVFFSCILCLFSANLVLTQEIPTDPNHLPQKIGPSDDGRSGGVTVVGKVVLEGQPSSQPTPTIYISVYQSGRFNQRKLVANNGSYILNNVPRNSVLSVEIEGNEVAQYSLIPSPAAMVYQDFFVNWAKTQHSINKLGTISAKDIYQRSDDNQKIFDKAISAIKEKKKEVAIGFFKQIIKNDAKDFVAWTQLGNLYFLNEKLTEAEESYKKSLEQKPDYMLALLNLGKVQLAQKETDQAIITLTKVAEAEPTSADGQHYLGEAYLQAKKGSKAVIYLNEALRLAPIEKAEIHLRLATLYNGAGLKDRAALEYKQYLEKVPKYKEKDKLEKYIKENLPK